MNSRSLVSNSGIKNDSFHVSITVDNERDLPHELNSTERTLTLPEKRPGVTKGVSERSAESLDQSLVIKPDNGDGRSTANPSLHLDTDDLTRCFIRTGFRPREFQREANKMFSLSERAELDNPNDSVEFNMEIKGKATFTVDFNSSQADAWRRLNYTHQAPRPDRIYYLYDCVIKVELHSKNKTERRPAVGSRKESSQHSKDHAESRDVANQGNHVIIMSADSDTPPYPEHTSIVVYDAHQPSTKNDLINYRLATTQKGWGLVMTSWSNALYLHVCSADLTTFNMQVQFLVFPRSTLQVGSYLSPGSGFIQTPMFDGTREYVTMLGDPWANVTVPPGHVIMLSFPLGEVRGCLTLSTDTTFSSHCCQEYPAAHIHRSTHLYVHFAQKCPYRQMLSFGFRLGFSFHADSVAPVQLTDGSWDCSLPHWPDFRQHLQCNLLAECQDKRDEVDCPHYSARCGPGYLTVGDKCLFFLAKLGEELHWYEAQARCQERGERLVTLKTEETRRIFLDFFATLELFTVYVGFQRDSTSQITWYRYTYQWVDGTVVYYINRANIWIPDFRSPTLDACAHIRKRKIMLFACDIPLSAGAVCEQIQTDEPPREVVLPAVSDKRFTVQTVPCHDTYLTHDFLACDATTSCWSRDNGLTCTPPLTPLPPLMTCHNGIGRVSYTLVCDHRSDCADNSDENFCDFPACGRGTMSCGDSQCIHFENFCNNFLDCHTHWDELGCDTVIPAWSMKTREPRLTITINHNGKIEIAETNERDNVTCPDTHFQCSDNGNCLPLFFRCNGQRDCLHHEDEADCGNWTCPGFYRCRNSRVCLHPDDVCDGKPNCPMSDDELMCNATCPENCLCQGHAFSCDGSFSVKSFPQLRYLDVSQTNLTSAEVTGTPLLVFLNLSQCGLTRLHDLTLPNLLYLDVSHNLLTSLNASHFSGVPQVREVSLSANPFLRLVDSGQASHTSLTSLDLSGVPLPRLNASVLAAFPSLQRLNLSGSGVQRVLDEGFQQLTQLRQVDLRGCPVSHVPAVMFQSVERLQKVYADSFRLCCPVLLPPDFNVHECEAPADEVSSCDRLMGYFTYGILNFVFALLALVGNCTSFLYRTFFSGTKSTLGAMVFITHLCVSDFLMGLYLLIIGIADRVYTGRYLWNDLVWRHSAACKVAGFLSLLSSEVSVLIICLITVDRFLVLRFPFSRMHFGVKSAHIASFAVWAVGLILVLIPLLSVTSHWEFYSQSSICIPLPVTGKDFAGSFFSFSIYIVLNFVLCLIICSGQLAIYWSVRSSTMSVANTNRKNKDLTITRRLLTVAMSDFLCWFPIGVLGLLASRGVPIPGEVNVAVAVLVLPINSALNPFLYILNVLMERKRLDREEKLLQYITSQLKQAAGN